MEIKDNPDQPVHLDNKEIQVQLVAQVDQVPKDKMEIADHKDSLVVKVSQDRWEIKERLEPQAQMVHLVHLDLQVMQGSLELLVNQERMDSKDRKVIRVLRDSLDQPEHLASLGSQVNRALLGILDLKELVVQMERLVHLAQQVIMVNLDLQDQLDLPEHRAVMVRLDLLEIKEMWARWDP